jgi:hypothetical protein
MDESVVVRDIAGCVDYLGVHTGSSGFSMWWADQLRYSAEERMEQASE